MSDVPQGPDWWQSSDGKWFPATVAKPRRVWPWRVRLAIVSVVLGIAGLTIMQSGNSEHDVAWIRATCDNYFADPERLEPDCQDQLNAGTGKILAGQIIASLAGLGIVIAFVSRGKS